MRFLLLFLFLLTSYLCTAQYTVSGFVRNDPNAGAVDNSGTGGTYSPPKDALLAVLVEKTGNTVFRTSPVNTGNGAFSFANVSAGTYYAMLITPDETTFLGDPAPFSILETSWTFTGESVVSGGIADGSANGITDDFIISGNFNLLQFGIQERPFAQNKMNAQVNNAATAPVALSVVTSPFTQGGTAILSGTDNKGGTITNYSITVLPKLGTLYLNGSAVSSLSDVASLTPAQFATLSYQPNGTTSLVQELDFFTYNVTDNALTKSNNATYVIPFPLLDSDGDGIANRFDQDDDNDGITDAAECSLNDPANGYANLLTAYGEGQAMRLKPSDFGFTTIAQRTGLNLTQDISSLFSPQKPAGSIIVTITNANTHPNSDIFYVNDITGPSQWTISGTLGSYVLMTHGLQFFSYDTRTATLLNGTPFRFVGGPTQNNPSQTNWSSTNDAYNVSLTNNNPVTNPISEGTLVLGSINPEPKYFQVASTANNRDEWATYVFDLLPECDDDNDGIPNRLDLDSDNDGCLDAFEGSATLQLANVSTATGTVTVGPGSSASNSNLCSRRDCVDDNGIPIIVGASGQSPVGTYNASVISQVCAMPVTLSAFNAYKTETGVLLKWSTVSEQNNKVFEIERSANGKSWANIGSVSPLTSDGNSNATQHYDFTDNKPMTGQNYYRLKQIDHDNTFAYSTIRTVNMGKDGLEINVFPNPSSTNLNISGLTGGESIKVFDLLGRVVYQQKAVGTDVQLPVTGLNEGLYNVQIVNERGERTVHKILIKK